MKFGPYNAFSVLSYSINHLSGNLTFLQKNKVAVSTLSVHTNSSFKMADISISLPAKRRRGRPRKDGNLSREATLRSPENRNCINNTTPHTATIYPTPDGLKNNKNLKFDCIIGSMIYGVIEGSFDAGYLISVRIGNNDTPLRGVIFQPKKFVPITAANDVAPQARMYQRLPFSDNASPIISSSGFGPQPPTASKQTVVRPFLPYYNNQPAFSSHDTTMMRSSSYPNIGCGPRAPMVGANQRSPSVHTTDETMQPFQIHGKFAEPTFELGNSTHNKRTGSNVELHHNCMEDMPGPAFGIQQVETNNTNNYKNPRDLGVNFHQDLFTGQSQPNNFQSAYVDNIPKSPNLNLDLSSVHETKQPQTNYFIHNETKSPANNNLGYHHALVSGNPLLLPPEFSIGEPLEFMMGKNQSLPNSKGRQQTSYEAMSSPSGHYKLELATPQSTMNEQTNNCSGGGCITDMDFVLSDVIQPVEHQGNVTKHR
ncbi:hypothetical protein CASFOL_028876 [Castilleja foliolosa]|uniref:Uncharacterized protein n=1 Tax=Castilleja foliolosa TaxID=1961234 RepID=A0ABD3CD66_9LAMI